jgi:hypothetical protein
MPEKFKVRFEVAEVFPQDDVVSQFVAGLCLITNDVGIVNEGIVREAEAADGRDGQSMHWFYHACSVYREGVRFLHFAGKHDEVKAFLGTLKVRHRGRTERYWPPQSRGGRRLLTRNCSRFGI